VFIPFYFFHAGTEIVRGHLTLKSLAIGLALVVVLVPLRIGVISLHRRFILGEPFKASRRIGAAMVPTLVFTLVIVGILQRRFGLDEAIAGGLVLYTVLNTVIPGFVLGAQPADFEDVEALPLETVPREG
jgi:Kef-type K+ transport system membrane component KefB